MSLLYGIVEGDARASKAEIRGERPVRIDKSTRSIQTIDYAHHEAHAGSLFSVETYSDNLASASSINIVVVTANTTEEPHMLILADTSLSGTLECFTGASVTGGTGSSATPLNHNFRSSNTSSCTVRTGMTVTGTGTLFHRMRLESGTGASRSGGENRGSDEYILAANTTYLFKLTSNANSNVVNLRLVWYEHTPRD